MFPEIFFLIASECVINPLSVDNNKLNLSVRFCIKYKAFKEIKKDLEGFDTIFKKWLVAAFL